MSDFMHCAVMEYGRYLIYIIYDLNHVLARIKHLDGKTWSSHSHIGDPHAVGK